MDWIVGFFILFGILFFWGVWLFVYWLPMAQEAQREYLRDVAREAERETERPEAEQTRGEPHTPGPLGGT